MARRAHGRISCLRPYPRRSSETRVGPRRTPFLSTKGREGPLRTATATPFCPRRAAKGRGELQRQHLFVHEGPRRAAENGNGNTFFHEGPRRAAENCNGNTFLSTKGREGPRRTATATPFLSTKGHEGPRRTATATPFCPRRAAKGREERQRQHLFVHEGPRRTATATPFSTKGHEGPRRTATATPFCPRRATKGREELQRQHLFVHEGPRGTLILVHIGLRRTPFGPRRTPFLIGEGRFLLPFLGRAGSLSMKFY